MRGALMRWVYLIPGPLVAALAFLLSGAADQVEPSLLPLVGVMVVATVSAFTAGLLVGRYIERWKHG